MQKEQRFRMDFKIRNQKIINEKERIIAFELIPDPERYDIKVIKGEKGYFDKFENFFIPEQEMLSAIAKQAKNLPLYYQPQHIGDIDHYIKQRKFLIEEFMTSDEQDDYSFSDKSEDFLESLSKDQSEFIIISIDIQGSTKLSQKLSSNDNAKVISLFLQEIAEIVPRFNGYILKYVGDGALAYFPAPSFLSKNDNAIDCASCIKLLIIKGINPVLKKLGYPEIAFRIGLDSGDAVVVAVGASVSKKHKDLIGETINIAKKIEGLADTNEIYLGQVTASNIHVNWRKLCSEIKLPDYWAYKDKATNQPYKVYKLNL